MNMKKLKRTLGIILSLVLVIGAAAGCGQKTANAPEFELKMAITNAPGSEAEQHIQTYVKNLETKSEGRIKVTVFAGETLAKGPDTYSAVVNGLADMAWNTATMTPGILPLTAMTTLPMMNIPDSTIGSKAIMELYNTNAAFKNEYKDVKVLAIQAVGGGAVIGTNNKVVKTLDDLKGMRIRVAPGAQTEFMKSVGAQPMNVPITEVWESMDKKVMDGYVFSFTAVNDFKLWDVTKNYTMVNLYTPSLYIVMNSAKYNSMPDDLKKIVDQVSMEANDVMNKWFETIIAKSIKKAETDFKDTSYTLPAAEEAKWNTAAQASWQTWYADLAKKNLLAKETTEAFMKLLEKHSK